MKKQNTVLVVYIQCHCCGVFFLEAKSWIEKDGCFECPSCHMAYSTDPARGNEEL